MDCCEAVQVEVLAGCPGCGGRGRRVQPATLGSLLREGHAPRDEPYRFCATPGCEVAWYGEASGHRLTTGACRVRIGQKETAVDRQLCYCFGYTAADLARDGGSEIPGAIAARCRRGEHRCPETNPQGTCCLGNVRAALRSGR